MKLSILFLLFTIFVFTNSELTAKYDSVVTECSCECPSSLYGKMNPLNKDIKRETLSTNHNGHVSLHNGWGEQLNSVTIRHRRGNDESEEEHKVFYMLEAGETTQKLAFTYETGLFSSYDYWWIKFNPVSGGSYTIKGNFYCSVTSDDDGEVTLRIDGSDTDMYVTFSESSGCYVSIDKV